jgi:hypothetical protein
MVKSFRLLPVLVLAAALIGCGSSTKTDMPKVKPPEGVGEFKSLPPPGSPGGGGGKAAGSNAGSQ